MRDALSPAGDASPVDARHDSLTSREFVALTGVSAERVRTWQRRFGFPATTPDRRGRRGFFATDVPRVLAVKQLVAAGAPVAEAVRDVQAGRSLQVDLDVLESSFGSLDTPVVAVAGPSPMAVVWANDAARAAAPDGADAVELPHALRDRSTTLQALLIEPPAEPVWLAHRPWFAEPATVDPVDALATPSRAVAWACGAPAFVPAVLLVMDVPAADEDGADGDLPRGRHDGLGFNLQQQQQQQREQTLVEHDWAVAFGTARRALQRGAGGKAIDQALGALISGGVGRDALLVLPQGDELRVLLSARGNLPTSALSPGTTRELRSTIDADVPVALGSKAVAELLAPDGGHSVATALLAGRAEVGFLVIASDDAPVLSEVQTDLLLAFATTLAAAITRDRAAAALRRVRGAE